MVPSSAPAARPVAAYVPLPSDPVPDASGMPPYERRRGLSRDPLLAAVAMQLGGEALSPVRTRLVRPGDVLAAAGEPPTAVYAVLSGRLGLYDQVPRADGKRSRSRLCELLGPGRRARETELLSDRREPPQTTIVAMSIGVVAVVDGDLFRSWCVRPDVAVIVLREMARDTGALEQRREHWADLDVPGRLAALLLELYRECWAPAQVPGREGGGDLWAITGPAAAGRGVLVPHELSQTDLGDLIGARRETVNRAGRQLEADGLIVAGPRGTTLLDIAALRRRAGAGPGARRVAERAVS
jgi:CRP-like cAMP-binding protein